MIQGYENHTFKSKFESWPVSNTTGNANTEEGRGKVTGTIPTYWNLKIDLLSLLIACMFYLALLKQKGVDVKGISKSSAPVNDEVPPLLLDGGGKLEV